MLIFISIIQELYIPMFGNMLSNAFNPQNQSNTQNNTQPIFQSWGQTNNKNSNNIQSHPNHFSLGTTNQNPQNSALNFKGINEGELNNTSAFNFSQNRLNQPNNMMQNNYNFGQTSYLFPTKDQKQYQYEMYQFLDSLADKITVEIMHKHNQSLSFWEKMTGQAPKTDKNIKNVVFQELVLENNLSFNQLFKYLQQRQHLGSNKINNGNVLITDQSKKIQGDNQESRKKPIFKSNYYDKIRGHLKQYGPLYSTDKKKGFIFSDSDDNFDAEAKNEIRLKQVEYHPQKINMAQKTKYQAKINREREEYQKFQTKVLEEICVKEDQLPIMGSFLISPSLIEMQQFHHTKLKNAPNVQLRNSYGQVNFLEPINLYKKIIAECIQIKKNEIEIKDPEWVNKKCEVTLFDFGEYAGLSEKVKKMIKEENEEDGQERSGEQQKKVRHRKKLIRKGKHQERLEKVQVEFHKMVKKWVLDNKYKIKAFDTKSGNLTLQL